MNPCDGLRRWLVAGTMTLGGILPAAAELPTLQEKQWFGYFLGVTTKKFNFGVTGQGKAAINVMDKKGGALNRKLAVQVDFVVEEQMPDGRKFQRAIDPASLASAQAATLKPQGVVFRGKVKGDAEFEVSVDEDRGVVSLGGRLVNPGKLTKNPVKFFIRFKFPEAYPYAKADPDKKARKVFEEKIEDDRIQLLWTDGKRAKPSTTEIVDAGSKEINGPGISSAHIEFSSYQEKKFEISASDHSVMTLSSAKPGPLHEGFFLTWEVDPAKDPEGKARVRFEVK